MKAFIYKTNQYLLERFPTIWNTRLVWMLLTALILHFVFFVFGYFTLSNPAILQERFVKDIFFNNGTVFLTSIISILLLVLWLIYMFKNNAFKNFYPTSMSKLFGQFLCYLLIIFSCSSFYLSYNYGIKSYIASTYSDAQINKEIEIANDVAMFFSENVTDYTIDQRRYPKPFYELYCEKTEDFIDYNKPHLKFEGKTYQFYSLISKEVPYKDRLTYINGSSGENDSLYNTYTYSIAKDSTSVLYFKDSVVDMQPYVKTVLPSYYNASSTFFISRNDTLNDVHYNFNHGNYSHYKDYNYNNRPQYSLRHQLRNQRNYELLKRNDKAEIKTLLEDFLAFSNYYKIPTNITADQWFDLVYHPENFEVKNFIRTIEKTKYEDVAVISTQQTKFEKFITDRLTDFHYTHDNLSNVFENIEDIKASSPIKGSIHFFMWFTFIIACFVFMFRITGLKPLLFSILTVGVLSLFVSLMAAFLFYISRGSEDNVAYFLMYIIFFISSIILAIPIFFAERVKKIIVAICVNISTIGFSFYLFLILGIISMHQDDACRNHPDYRKEGFQCDTILESVGFDWSYILFFAGIIFLFFYSAIIKKWKALPEG